MPGLNQDWRSLGHLFIEYIEHTELFKDSRTYDMEVLENTKEHQRKNTECGIYSIYFMTSLLENKDPEYFINERITDDEMFSLRDKFFN